MKLTIASSPVLEELRQYEKDGVIVIVCGTFLEPFKLTEKKQVGGTKFAVMKNGSSIVYLTF